MLHFVHDELPLRLMVNISDPINEILKKKKKMAWLKNSDLKTFQINTCFKCTDVHFVLMLSILL